ncbi:MAG: hypothetical protein NC410_11580, partial [Oscillibacter sp.]|nr:hypothetical protein [Oscillibacter sp.]
TPQQVIEKDKKGIQVACIQMFLYLKKTDLLYQEMAEAGINLEEELMAWDDKYLEVLNKLNMELFYVNKYYKNTAEIPWQQNYDFIDDSEYDWEFDTTTGKFFKK